jgi:hypothetical protein
MPHEAHDYIQPLVLETSSTALRGFLANAAVRLEDYTGRIPSFSFFIGIAVLLVLAVACSRGGYAPPETEQYIPHYLSHRPLLQKIYDYKQVEVGAFYRPRPLSYMVDDFDVAFIAWSARHGFPHLLSLSYYIFWVLDCLLLWFYFEHRLGLHRFTAALLICLFSTDSVVFSNTGYFRSAKPAAAFFSFERICSFFRMLPSRTPQAASNSMRSVCVLGSPSLAIRLPFRRDTGGFFRGSSGHARSGMVMEQKFTAGSRLPLLPDSDPRSADCVRLLRPGWASMAHLGD